MTLPNFTSLVFSEAPMKSKVEQQKFQSYEDKTENGQQQVQRLDDETESILGTVAACYSAVGYASSSPRSKKRALDDAGESMVALRRRIKHLIINAIVADRASGDGND